MCTKRVIIWGVGHYLESVINRIDPDMPITALCDSDCSKWGNNYTCRNLLCIPPSELCRYNDFYVYICTKNISAEKEIASFLDDNHIPFCHINEVILEYQPTWEKKEIEKYNEAFDDVPEPNDMNKLSFFASISVPVEQCNLRCKYCYIGQRGQLEPKRVIYHSPEFIRKALSRKRLNGTAMINFCGVGETLLCAQLLPIIAELLKEGHYVSVITNGLLRGRIEELLKLEDDLCSRLFFKCSFHYVQLKQRNLLRVFSENVKMIKRSPASFSVELVPDDETVEFIDEIKSFALEQFGALPQLTVARDESENGIPLLTKMSEREYYQTWESFKSSMFDFKMKNKNKISDYCLAGEKSALFSLDDGDVMPCPFNKQVGNIFNDISSAWKGKAVGDECNSPWCINAHAYLCLGLVGKVKGVSYLNVRDRETLEGTHWVKSVMADFIEQRICDNIT